MPTRKPGKPRIHVQSRRGPTCPPLLVAHQERTPSNSGWARWDRASSSRPPSRPPTQLRSAQVAEYYLTPLYSNRRTAFFGHTQAIFFTPARLYLGTITSSRQVIATSADGRCLNSLTSMRSRFALCC